VFTSAWTMDLWTIKKAAEVASVVLQQVKVSVVNPLLPTSSSNMLCPSGKFCSQGSNKLQDSLKSILSFLKCSRLFKFELPGWCWLVIVLVFHRACHGDAKCSVGCILRNGMVTWRHPLFVGWDLPQCYSNCSRYHRTSIGMEME
jgi:hypothetical protein